jgi:outer membrane protein OmpA-like peptidoglycan-associated protein
MPVTRCLFLLPAVLGLASPLAGCATRHFVRDEIGRSEAALRPAVDRLVGDLQEYRTGVREFAVMVAEASWVTEKATRGAIEALGLADAAAGRAADAVDHAILAQTRADQASALAAWALLETQRTAQRLAEARASLSVVEVIVLHFEFDAWALDRQARTAMLDVASRLRENPALSVQMEGHADSLGAPPYNLHLSQLRAESVRRFLVELGIETRRLQAIGLGTARPVADNAIREGRRQNRRVIVRLFAPS